MKKPSFRVRIALLSATITGASLIAFSFVFWWLIYNAYSGRLDAELKNKLLQTNHLQEQPSLEVYETQLTRDFKDTPIKIWVLDRDGYTRYQSINGSDLNLQVSNFPDFPHPPRPPHPPDFPNDFGFPDDLGFPHPPRPPRNPLPPIPPQLKIITRRSPTGLWRVGLVSFPDQKVAIAVNLSIIDQEMASVRNGFLVSIPILLLLIAGGSWALSGSALHSIQKLTNIIQQVTARGLDQRIPLNTTDIEFVELIQVFNQMLERLERSFKQASRFSGDAAHELKTPLAILQGELEQMLQKAETESSTQQALSHLLDEVRRLGGTTRKLLLLSLADAGQMRIYQTQVNLYPVLLDMMEDIELLAPDLIIKTEIDPELIVLGDQDLLTQVVQNLISNAIKYNLPEGWIKIQSYQRGKKVIINISNASKDIPLKDRDRLFDRFYRGDPARTRQIEGIGLGLSLAREIAHAHQGDLTLDPPQFGQTSFTFTLPRFLDSIT
ncbi:MULTISPECIES: ATP-binding protein [Planktothrix]|uniref:histidine kinase n=1 Tax=Planktothrix rubescens CCAP 1459/22 TaxID=329571 RepID=A0A6J7ZJD0_PLARU|nr:MULTISPECIES: ATP-binding protein [Planktothrix]CAC5341928.1 Signal transduction histidine kinase [Planktothrix rubescens NIVA-CYA 18]CAD5928041.1 putative sensor protein PcoS [Planktothrix rubescens NIVA-CYA 18]CAD5963384.1 putative sensor protein PcoS [Planktothrix agardhii]